MKETNLNGITNKVLDAIAWGVFAVMLGAGWLLSAYCQTSTITYIALGVGSILTALNVARYGVGIRVSKFSLFVGLLALALSGAGLAGDEMPLISTVIALIGLFVVAEAV